VSCLYKGRYIKRPLEEVVRDIKQIKDLGFKKILLLDDNIFSDRDYLHKLLDTFIELNVTWMSQCEITIGHDNDLLQKLYKSGCQTLSFGLESITKESLDKMDKSWAKPSDYDYLIQNIRKHGIDVSTEMVVGAEGDTLESIRKTKDFIEKNKISVPRFYILTPFPGTRFFEQIEKAGRLVNKDIYSYDGTSAVYKPQNMTPDELTAVYWELYENLFTFKSIIKRNILRKEMLKMPHKYLFNTIVNLYYREQIKRRITPNIF